MIKPDITPEAIDRLIESIKVSAVDTYLDAIAALRTQAARISELEAMVPPQVRMEEIGDGDWQDIGPQTLLEARNEALRDAAKAIEFKYNDADTDQNGDPKLSWAHEEILALIKDPTT
jgi:hypothetical protein